MKRTTFLLLLMASVALVALSACGSPEPPPPEMVTRETTIIRETVPRTTARDMIVRETPPLPREESKGFAPSAAHVWVPGYWAWDNGWTWQPGRWELPPQSATVWVPGQWVRTDRGWMWQPGRWQ